MLLYNIFFTLILPLIFMRLLWRSRKAPLYKKRWLERLGCFKSPNKPGGIFIHAVSVGEVMAALPVIYALKEKYPEELITVTTTTPTGSERVMVNLGDSVFHVYLPYDISWAINNFLRLIKPRICIILETELWPNLILCCKRQDIPVLIINGTLSYKSYKGYRVLKTIVKSMLNKVTYVAAQSELDGNRFLELGLEATRLLITGSIKYDVPVSDEKNKLGDKLKQSFGNRLVWIAASTHEGEEGQILSAFKVIKASLPNVLLILVPRHPERFDKIYKMVKDYDFQVIKRSANEVCSSGTDVLLGDTMGELGVFYKAADLAFVGGSLVPVGGHNVFEACAVGVPVITGPYIDNIKEISKDILNNEAMLVLNNEQELVNSVLILLQSHEKRQDLGKRGQSMVKQNQGATQKVLELIDETYVIAKVQKS